MIKRAMNKTMMILTATALAGVTLPMSTPLACGGYGDLEPPRPEDAQSWTCQTTPRDDPTGGKVVDVMRLDTTGGEDTMWGFLLGTVPAKGPKSLEGRPNDFGLPAWSPDELQIQMYGRRVVLKPARWYPRTLHATLFREFGETTVVNTFLCSPTPTQ